MEAWGQVEQPGHCQMAGRLLRNPCRFGKVVAQHCQQSRNSSCVVYTGVRSSRSSKLDFTTTLEKKKKKSILISLFCCKLSSRPCYPVFMHSFFFIIIFIIISLLFIYKNEKMAPYPLRSWSDQLQQVVCAKCPSSEGLAFPDSPTVCICCNKSKRN